ncbi:unnamed protein product [Porites evermanni]|uniref:Transmembrane protein n=1 Tax=Porites evermanni TaxID=104178 RepID=A0ABN8MD07_9CNID|nr:unnamed protein product [Porites evermanni]
MSNNGRCRGQLVLTAYVKKGFGGAMVFPFKCCGCWTVEIDYKSSYLTQESRRQLVSLAISLAFLLVGMVMLEKPLLEVCSFVMRNSGRGQPSQLRGISVECYGPKPKKRG